MALSGTVITTARLAGTALGGVAVALLALQGVVLVAVVGYLAVLLLVWSVRVPEASPPREGGSAAANPGPRAPDAGRATAAPFGRPARRERAARAQR